jgi:MFS family permease
MPSRLLLLLPLLLPFLRFDTAFVVVIATSTAVETLMLPVQNWTLARNYAESTRGRRFGLASAVQAAAIVAVVLPAGWLLDHQPEVWPALYAIAGLAGVMSYMHWSRLRRRARRKPLPADDLADHGSPWAALRDDKRFLAFEACFMAYGIGFLMLQPVLPIYLVDELKVTYSQVGIARGLLFWLGMVVASPALGWLGDRIGIFRMTAIAFLAVTAFPLVLLMLHGTTGLYLGYSVYGLAMGGVAVAWNVGPIVLARGRDPLPYLNAHVGLVGVRALIGMVAGTWIQYASGTAAVFWCVVVLEIVAATGMALVARRIEPRPSAASS